VSESIRLINVSIGGINVFSKISGLETISGSLLRFQNSFLSGSDSTGSRIDRLETTASLGNANIRALLTSSNAWLAFSSSTFPAYIQFTSNSIVELSSSLSASLEGLVSDADQLLYSESVAATTYDGYQSGSYLSQSIWSNLWTPEGSPTAVPGLSRSLYLSTFAPISSSLSWSLNDRIKKIISGTGFLEVDDYNSFATSSNNATSSLFLSASALAISASGALNTNTLQSQSLNELNSYTSSLKSAISASGNDLYVNKHLYISGNIVAQNYIIQSESVYITTSFSEGNTIFGNSYNDTHWFNGDSSFFGKVKLLASGSSSSYPTQLDVLLSFLVCSCCKLRNAYYIHSLGTSH
jgi:hypothetical protein